MVESRLQELRTAALAAIEQARTAEALEAVRIRYLGRRGLLREVTAALGTLPPEERRRLGALANSLKESLTAALEAARQRLAVPEPTRTETLDITLPGHRPPCGSIHPITRVMMEITDIFRRLGFETAFGPEVELEYYNFEALNIPVDHPSRDSFDTFYVGDEVLLRSHTSPVQIRVMEQRRPPVQVIVPGKCYRPDTVDARHMFMFHQVEGLMVGEHVTFADLKYVLHQFARAIFDPGVRMRFRPSFFPFTEPSAEVDISCFVCQGGGCSLCANSGWLEILGSGMVNPRVFEYVGYDPERYTGFAFGMGVERVAMLKYGISDIRLFTQNDLGFLRQFRATI